MNKSIVIAGSIIAGITLPLLGMTITPTRDAILGLAPDQAVLQLADQIDAQRVSVDQAKLDAETAKAESDAKINELQSQVSNQQQVVADQNKVIEEQNVKNVENQKISKCAEMRSKYVMCNSDNYRKTLGDFLNKYKGEHRLDSDSQDEISVATKNYNICQDVYSQCD